jgi:hypothetical protein
VLRVGSVVCLGLLSCVVIPPPTKLRALQPGWYDFSVETATITTVRDNGRGWDLAVSGAEPPDAYVEVFIGDQTYRTPVIKNSYQPRWVGSFAVLLGASEEPVEARILVWDYDFLEGDDPIGTTTIDLNQVIKAGGSLKIDTFGYVVNLTLTARFDTPDTEPTSISSSLPTKP